MHVFIAFFRRVSKLRIVPVPRSRVSVVTMTGATIVIGNASAANTILSVKGRVYAANRKLPVRRQRLVYLPGPHGIEPLADNETLGDAGVAEDGSAKLDVLLVDLTAEEMEENNLAVLCVLNWSRERPPGTSMIRCPSG